MTKEFVGKVTASITDVVDKGISSSVIFTNDPIKKIVSIPRSTLKKHDKDTPAILKVPYVKCKTYLELVDFVTGVCATVGPLPYGHNLWLNVDDVNGTWVACMDIVTDDRVYFGK